MNFYQIITLVIAIIALISTPATELIRSHYKLKGLKINNDHSLAVQHYEKKNETLLNYLASVGTALSSSSSSKVDPNLLIAAYQCLPYLNNDEMKTILAFSKELLHIRQQSGSNHVVPTQQDKALKIIRKHISE